MAVKQKEIIIKKIKFDKDELYLLLVVCCALFTVPLTITSSSILNLSVMLKFGLNYYQAQWFISLFMIFYASFMVMTGSLADILGRKKIFLIGLLLLFIGFFVSGITNQYSLLLITRAICGIGAAAITTSGTALLAVNLKVSKKEKAFSIFGCALGLGMVCGPLAADYAAQRVNGLTIFPLSMSLILLFILFMSIFIHDRDKINAIKVEIDWIGGVTLTISLLLMVLALSFMPIWGCFDFKSFICLFSALSFLVFFLIDQSSGYSILACATTSLLFINLLFILYFTFLYPSPKKRKEAHPK